MASYRSGRWKKIDWEWEPPPPTVLAMLGGTWVNWETATHFIAVHRGQGEGFRCNTAETFIGAAPPCSGSDPELKRREGWQQG